jgi:hypothetical protein
MNDALISDLQRYVGQPGVAISEEAEHVQVRIERCGLSVSLVIPKSVLEFFIDVHDAAGVHLIHDWLDYAGYDSAPESQLAEEMRAEALTFIGRLVDRNLRLVHGDRHLEWQTGERWLQAVPFVPGAEQALAADARKPSRG